MSILSAEHADVSCLMSCILEYPGLREPIRGVAIGDVFYLDLRYWGYAWFDDLDLPDA